MIEVNSLLLVVASVVGVMGVSAIIGFVFGVRTTLADIKMHARENLSESEELKFLVLLHKALDE